MCDLARPIDQIGFYNYGIELELIGYIEFMSLKKGTVA
jgi:hypothetical protein